MSREIGNSNNFERLAGELHFQPAGQSGWINMGDVVMQQEAHKRGTKTINRHPRTAIEEQVRVDVTSANLVWQTTMQERFKEMEAMLLFGDPAGPLTQTQATAGTLTINAVALRMTYEIGAYNVSNVTVTVAAVAKIVGRLVDNVVTPANADVVLDPVMGTLYLPETSTIAAAANLTVTFDKAAVAMDVITPLTNPNRTGTFKLMEWDGLSTLPVRIVRGLCYLSPSDWGSQDVTADANKTKFEISCVGAPVVLLRQT